MTAAPDTMPENTLGVDEGGLPGHQVPSSTSPAPQPAAANKACPPPHYQVLGEGADPDSISMFYMTVYKASDSKGPQGSQITARLQQSCVLCWLGQYSCNSAANASTVI
eukprot:GHUV01013309.1.p2 GENE.GHUV01013309.1~~GHUV01013309.1.p2  ORF type:complete len:109 (+),score=22.73 GHUV01013309.1:316-642(+)